MYQKMLSRAAHGLARIIAGGTILFSAQAVQAGPVFEIIGGGLSAPFALSNSWGISGTGGGAMIGSITLRDGFVLPTSGSITSGFTASDIVEVSYSHIRNPLTNNPVFPGFSFTAGPGDLASATGQVQFTGANSFLIQSFNLNIETTVEGALFAIFSGFNGVVEGDFFINGITAGIHGTTAPTDFDVSLIANSTAPGNWLFTGFSQTSDAVPEPGALAIFGLGLAGIVITRRRKRS